MPKIFETIVDQLELKFGRPQPDVTLVSYLTHINQVPTFELRHMRESYMEKMEPLKYRGGIATCRPR